MNTLSETDLMEIARYPLLKSPDYLTVDRVWRIEDADGNGPIVGKAANAVDLIGYFKAHMGPHRGIVLNRQVHLGHKPFFRPAYPEIFKNGIYGWRSRELYDAFFIGDGESKCNEAGFFMKEFTPEVYVPMPDGQVLFLRN